MHDVAQEMNALIALMPDKARERVLGALRRNGMVRGRAAEDLGVRLETFSRWVSRLGLDDAVRKLVRQAKADGTYEGDVGGCPTGTKRERVTCPRCGGVYGVNAINRHNCVTKKRPARRGRAA